MFYSKSRPYRPTNIVTVACYNNNNDDIETDQTPVAEPVHPALDPILIYPAPVPITAYQYWNESLNRYAQRLHQQIKPLAELLNSSLNRYVYFITPVIGMLSAISVPMFILYLEDRYSHLDHPYTLVQQIFTALLPWIVVGSCRIWLLHNTIIGRIERQLDTPLSDEIAANDSWHIFIAFIANLSSVTNAMLVVLMSLAGSSNNPVSPALWTAAVLAGVSNGITTIYTEVAAAFRKHAEVCNERNRPISMLFHQPLFQPFAARALLCGHLIMISYPTINGWLRAYTGASLFKNALVSFGASNATAKGLAVIVGYLIYSATAFSLTHLKVEEINEYLVHARYDFDLRNYWEHQDNLTKFIFQATSGILFFWHLANRVGINASVRTVTFIHQLGLIAFITCSVIEFCSMPSNNKHSLLHHLSSNTNRSRLNVPVVFFAASASLIEAIATKGILEKSISGIRRRYEVHPEPAANPMP
ncbi:MAG: hypothetical protein V4496_01090 [Pseudomonadota bacterium]